LALTQMLGVGAAALIALAVGRNDRADANHVFNQSLALSAVCAAVTLIGGYAFGAAYMRSLGADAATITAGVTFLHWFIPGLALMAVFVAVVYWIIRDFGVAAQAGFGVGMRIMQMIFLPAMALAFAAAPIAGQNFGARQPARVRETFRATVLATCAVMLVLTL